jgi:Beta-carotene isomerase D27-like, C-terminal
MCATSPPPVAIETPRKPDGLFARGAIAVFRRIMRKHVGRPSARSGYDGLVDDCRLLLAQRGPSEQRQIVLGVLSTLFVAPKGQKMFREKFADKPGMNARITPLFFQWLVGPAAVNDSPELPEGVRPGTGVLIEKCRFLDEAGCRGLCLSTYTAPY